MSLLRIPILLILLAPGVPDAASEEPLLRIVSDRLDDSGRVRVFNREPAMFFARVASPDPTPLLRDVDFFLCDRGGTPDRAETVRVHAEAQRFWGAPPAAFVLPLADERLPPGEYELFARRAGNRDAHLSLVTARFGYEDLDDRLEADSWRAAFRIRLTDTMEARRSIPVTVSVTTAEGVIVDEREITLGPAPRKTAVFESAARVRLDSRKKTPDRDLPASARTGVLRAVPGGRLVLVLDGVRFSWPLPLPREAVEGASDGGNRKDDGEEEPGRKVRDPSPRRGSR